MKKPITAYSFHDSVKKLTAPQFREMFKEAHDADFIEDRIKEYGLLETADKPESKKKETPSQN